MGDVHLQHRATDLAARVEAFAKALQATDVSVETSAELLSNVSAAVLQALTLELLVEESGALAA